MGTKRRGHKETWAQNTTFLGTKRRGHKIPLSWAYRDVGTKRRGHKETWAQRDVGTKRRGHKEMLRLSSPPNLKIIADDIRVGNASLLNHRLDVKPEGLAT